MSPCDKQGCISTDQCCDCQTFSSSWWTTGQLSDMRCLSLSTGDVAHAADDGQLDKAAAGSIEPTQDVDPDSWRVLAEEATTVTDYSETTLYFRIKLCTYCKFKKKLLGLPSSNAKSALLTVTKFGIVGE